MAYTASADGATVVFGSTTYLVDQHNQVFYLDPNGSNTSSKLYCNGTLVSAASTSLKKMQKYRGCVYYTDGASWWTCYTVTGAAPVQILVSSTAATPWLASTATSSTLISPNGGAIIDKNQDVWGFASTAVTGSGNAWVTRNGNVYAVGAAASLLPYNGDLYVKNFAAAWFKANSAGGWTSTTDPRGVAVPATTFADDFVTLDVSLQSGSGKWVKSRWYPPDDDLGYPVNNSWMVGSSSTFSSVASSLYNVSGGILQLGIIATPSGLSSAAGGLPYLGGQLVARALRQLYGYFEAKIRVPNIPGTNCAFWLVGDGAWPPEIDIAEIVSIVGGGQFPMQTLWNLDETIQQQGAYGTTLTNTWHTYGVDWGPNTTTFYLDRVATVSYATPAGYTNPMFPLLSMQDGKADWTGGIQPGTTLGYMEVDYVYAYAQGQKPF